MEEKSLNSIPYPKMSEKTSDWQIPKAFCKPFKSSKFLTKKDLIEGIDSPNIWKRVKKDLKNWWVATEKVHGANFSFMTNGEFVKHGKRKELLKEDSNFLDIKRLLQNSIIKF